MVGDARVGPYRIIRLVNRGGQGSVYLGYDKRLQRRVAIKVYPLPVQRNSRRQLLKEARVVASLDSPRIVQIYAVIESQEHIAMVMEYVPGCDLEEFLTAVRPSLASILVIAGDLAAALSVARQQQIVHGDLKAGNVLIAADGRVTLTDFGIARRSAAAAKRPHRSACCRRVRASIGSRPNAVRSSRPRRCTWAAVATWRPRWST